MQKVDRKPEMEIYVEGKLKEREHEKIQKVG